MAGVKGRSGGARSNAGRKAKPKEPPTPPAQVDERDPLAFLLDVMQGLVDANMMQVRAAIAAAQYVHTKKADGGKKEEAQERAEQAAGKFRRSAPPKLVAAGGQKV